MTPGYLGNKIKGKWTIIDEFQTLRHYNKSYVEDDKNHNELVLMSATPFVPLMDAIQKA
jgi:hypothetical protein